ncbi:MAG: pyridoxamine 5'-phosphate oxidase family protein, partial [Gemmatimonadales bacterium]
MSVSAEPLDVTLGHRSTIRAHPDRSAADEAPAILAAGIVAHVGFVADGQPFVIPMAYHCDPENPRRLYLHGAPATRLIQHLATGAPACVTVTLVDGLVYSRTALYHSVNYRSVVCFARASGTRYAAADAAVLDRMIARYF